ncbi:response regulator transcription factor [Lentzea sp. HUAS TT2]|uniref:helix-turn-helix transcriptional regulator n=1 Tax=Lentzea sp. HUAS TT2 TaxID=3447454 RepID=UPI003F6E6622
MTSFYAPGPVYRVLAADATPVFREGLRTAVQRTIGLEWAGGTDHPDVIRDSVRTAHPHVVLLDSAIDPHSRLAEELITTIPRLRVAVLFRERDHTPASVRVARAAGAQCLLSRDTDASAMFRAILRTPLSGHYVDPALAPSLTVPSHRPERWSRDVLTSRQRQTLALVAEGKADADIAHSLNVAVTTVRTHVRQVRRRLGALDRAHAVALAYHVGILPLHHRPTCVGPELGPTA